MRAGAYTIHQSLTAEAAAVLKLAHGLARRRGHAQVTPLHVAFALLTQPTSSGLGVGAPFSSSSPSPYGLLKRACLRSHHPGGAAAAAAHPLQCRALELCFNVALNRLPTSMLSHSHSPPPGGSSFASSLIQPSPTLSNALVAALKRAQANQRRGCVDLHHQPPPSAAATSTQQQQSQQQAAPLLAIKVELDQLVISILDDPSVSRVMREAGFSSATVKSNLEDDDTTSTNHHSPPPPQPITIPPQHHFLPTTCSNGFGMWPAQTQFLDADVRAVLDVMLRRRSSSSNCNPVVVGDSASMAEAVAGELLRRLERGDVPEDLAGAHLLRLHHLSYVHVRLMTRADVDARAAELRRGVDAVQQLRQRGGLVVFVGDLRWAIRDDDEGGPAAAYSPVEHMVAELGRLVEDIRASRGRAWIVATASYQTYMRWRRRRQATEAAAWALQAVLVPTGGCTGLALNNLHHHTSASAAAGVPPAMLTMQSPLAMAPPPHHAEMEAEEKLVLCAECSKNYEREASLVKAEAADAEGPRASLPAWLVPGRKPPPADEPQHKEKYLVELKRKWSRLCGKLHLCVDPPCPWWSGPCMPPSSRPTMPGLLGLEGLMAAHNGKSSSRTPPARWGLTSLREQEQEQDVVGTALALSSNLQPLSDTASSDGGRAAPPVTGGDGSAAREMERRLRRNIPWQPAAVAAAIAGAERGEELEKGDRAVWMYVKGGDHAAVRRAAAVVAEATDRVVVRADASGFGCAEELCADVVARASDVGGGRRKLVLVVGDVERAAADVVDCLVAASRSGSLKDRSSGKEELHLAGCVVILTTAKVTGGDASDLISLRLWSEQDEPACGDGKRKPDTQPSPTTERSKRPRHDHGLDLNVDLCAGSDDVDCNDEEEEDEAIPSDITHEEGSSDVDDHQPRGILEQSVAVVVTLDERGSIRGHLRARLARALNVGEQHNQPGATARVEDEAVEALAAASGQFLEETLERWVAEVLEPAAATVSGKVVVVLGVGRGDGAQRTESGFVGSVLPSRVHVD